MGETKQISHYQILGKLGEGGMGTVYKAEDTRLQRNVAIKVLSKERIDNAEVRQRFEREARTISSLNHPHICTLHDVGREDDRDYLVMEFVEGKPLKGAIPVEEALEFAVQIADALDHAHRRGIVHRDLKPGNVMVTTGGAKLMDFGIAKFAPEPGLIATETTTDNDLTQKGEILGTLRFMAPEQWEGKEADARSDIFAFGALLYEIITGERAFHGKSRAAVVAAVMHQDPPPISSLKPLSPVALDHVVKKCLEKDPDRRWRSAADLRDELEWIKEATPSQAFLPVPPVVERRLRLMKRWLYAAAGALALCIATVLLIVLGLGRSSGEVPLRKFALVAEPIAGAGVQVSPDGRRIAYISGAPPRLFVQELDQVHPREIPDTEGAHFPFWSPGSDAIAFVQGTDVKKVAVRGGPAMTVCPLPGRSAYLFSGAWSPDGQTVVFSAGNPRQLYQAPARGGTATPLIDTVDRDPGHAPAFPQFLPASTGRRAILYFTGNVNQGQIMALDLDTGQQEVLSSGGPFVYARSGHILYQPSRDDSSFLFALPFDAKTLQTTGEAFPVAEDAAYPSVAADGTLVYLGVDTPSAEQLVWRARDGTRLGAVGDPHQEIRAPALSPNGDEVLLRAREGANWDIWLHHVDSGLRTRLTFDSANEDRPVWSPEGERFTFTSDSGGVADIFIKSADGSGQASEFWSSEANEYGIHWSPDGANLACVFLEPGGPGDIWLLHRQGADFEAVPFVKTDFDELEPVFSPGGRYLAYSSAESGRYEVYVRNFPEDGGFWQVSTNGGQQPRWRADSRELYYVERNTLIAVPVETRPSFSMGVPKRLFVHQTLGTRRGHQYDVAADGERFLVVEPVGGAPAPTIRIVQNWFAEFRERE